MPYQTVSLEIEDHIAIIKLNRPEKLNSYTVQMGEDIVSAFEALKADDNVKVVILTGEGKAFCAGVDLDVLKNMDADAGNSGLPRLGEEYLVRGFGEDLFHYPKPVIAAMNGAAVGVGVTMTLPCDIRIAARSAKLGLIFAKLGILPGVGSTYILPRLVGPSKAKELIYTAELISAPEAAEIGLIDKVVEDGQALQEALVLAKKIAAFNPKVIGLAKQALNFGLGANSIHEALQNELKAMAGLRSK